MLRITNSLTSQKEPLAPHISGKINLYVCGITPYDFSHIGHGRCYVVFDMIYRYLSFLGYDVNYCRNFTDIDDKLLNKAEIEFQDRSRYAEIAQRYIDAYHQDMSQLNCLSPDHEPRVTQTIPQIIAFVEGLIANGSAYALDGSVYFRVRLFDGYGKLSKQDINDLRAGARIDVDDQKEDPLDFALWKADEPSVSYQSPWGFGRPGWHIECSAMARDYFKSTVDIHGGGMDLMFPHHENEIAQSESLYPKPFAKYWMHNAFVRINKEKMSKSLNNFFTLKDILKDFDPMVLRFYFMKHYYRGPLDFSIEDLQVAEKTYKRLVGFFGDVESGVQDLNLVRDNSVVQAMSACLDDDFNTSGLFGVLFESLDVLQQDVQAKAQVKFFLQQVMGLTLEPIAEKEVIITPEIQALLESRKLARVAKNWKLADEIRDQLKSLGFEVQDSKL
ncbi:cysteine--tRNA ligase [Candidatus Babeliales bacterium]|nr:cysteine--tRNA ligase [Candidatus Babeliales bacterium]MBP9843678.1 cysteine--tRNA ligase [Candidatus Babeliales bacterium]